VLPAKSGSRDEFAEANLVAGDASPIGGTPLNSNVEPLNREQRMMMQKLWRSSVGLFIALTCIQSASAWQEGVDQDEPLTCEGLPMAGAESVVIRIKPTNGSFGVPTLIGIKDGKDLWRYDLPKSREANAAKFVATCKGKVIRLRFQYPAQNTWIGQQFRWDGKTVKWLCDEPIR
jgi:hypothetical protein